MALSHAIYLFILQAHRDRQMKLFQRSFFTSSNSSAERHYQDGVRHLKANDHYRADQALRTAAEGGHVSALYNLSILHGCGAISPYDLDFATQCFYEAAKLGHPAASKNLFMLEGADRGGFGTHNLAQLASNSSPQEWFSSLLMICATRYFNAVARLHDATDEVIAYELHGASVSDYGSVQSFVQRTGVPSRVYRNRPPLEEGSAADQITDGLNAFSMAQRSAGNSERICMAARCTIVGYMISKSSYGMTSLPLLGLDQFFKQ